MKFPYLDRIWRTTGSLELDEPITPEVAIERLSFLFDRKEVDRDGEGITLNYRKANPAAQDKLATFSSGTLRIANREGRAELQYDVRSPALLLTFLAPLLFLALGQAIVGLGILNETMSANSRETEDASNDEPNELHWIDEMLGAPAPDEPEQNKGKEKEKGKRLEEGAEEIEIEEDDEEHSPMRAYGLAVIFVLIYLFGRVIEPRLFRSTLRKALSGDHSEQVPGSNETKDQFYRTQR